MHCWRRGSLQEVAQQKAQAKRDLRTERPHEDAHSATDIASHIQLQILFAFGATGTTGLDIVDLVFLLEGLRSSVL